jgi:hypothetical protein
MTVFAICAARWGRYVRGYEYLMPGEPGIRNSAGAHSCAKESIRTAYKIRAFWEERVE